MGRKQKSPVISAISPTRFVQAYLLCCIACVAVYLQTLPYSPVYDDVEFIARNPITFDPSAVLNIFESTYTGMMRADITYRPLTVWSFALNRGFNSLFGLDPMQPYAFHLTNLLLHALVTCLFFRLLWKLGQPYAISLGAALLFAVLPIHIEAVTGIVGRAELFAALFGLLFLSAHLQKKTAWACFFYLLSMFGKESGIVFCVVAFLIDAANRSERLTWRPCYHAYLFTLFFWLGVRQVAIQGAPYFLAFVDNPTTGGTILQRIFTASRYQLEYLARMVFPYHLASDSSYNQIPIISSPWNGYVCLFLAILALALLVAWRLRQTQPMLWLFLAFYVVVFSPTSNFIRAIGSTVGERLAYTPSLAVCVWMAIALSHAFKKKKSYRVALALCVAIYGCVTIHRNLSWKDELTFFHQQVTDSPRSAKAHYNYGTILAKYNREPEAIPEYRIALKIFPYYSEAFYNLGNALQRTGAPADDVIEAYHNTIKYDPGHQAAMGNLLLFLTEHQRMQEAAEVANLLAHVNPRHPALQRVIGSVPHQ